jgi:hydrogenase maturation protease
MKQSVLIAGIGNIFLQDDGFGVEVAHRLGAETLSEVVRVADFGIRGIHLAYELLEREYDLTVLVDAIARGDKPGTLYLVEPDLENLQATGEVSADAHAMTPQQVFQLLNSLGGSPGRVLIVGCEPLETGEGIGLSEPVAGAVEEAVKLILDVVRREVDGTAEADHARKKGS